MAPKSQSSQIGSEAKLAANHSAQAEHACSEQEQAAWLRNALAAVLRNRNVIQSHVARIIAEREREGIGARSRHCVYKFPPGRAGVGVGQAEQWSAIPRSAKVAGIVSDRGEPEADGVLRTRVVGKCLAKRSIATYRA